MGVLVEQSDLPSVQANRGYYSSFPIYAPIADKNGQVYNVKAYGANGNGSADDTTAIQAAIAAASAAGGGTAFLPAGTYKVTAPLVPANNVKIQGAGIGSTTIAGYGQQFAIILKQATLNNPIEDVEICDLTIDGTNVTHSSISPIIKGVYMQYCKRLRIHDVYVYNTWATGLGVDFLVDSIIDDCILDSCGVRGIAAGMGTGCNGVGIGTGAYAIEDWVCANCVAYNTGNNAFMAEDQFQTIRSQGNQFANCIANGGKFGFRTSGSCYISFTNCMALGTAQNGFYVTTGDVGTLATAYNPQQVYFVGCSAIGCGTGGAFDGFIITDAKATPDGTLSGIYFNSCNSISSSEHGFQAKNATNVSFVNCNAEKNQTHGLLAFSSNSAAPFNGLLVQGGNFLNNSQTSAGFDDGVRIGATGSGTMSNAKVLGVNALDNQGTQTQRYGISTTGTISNSLIQDNNVNTNRNAAINIGNASSTLYIRNNIGYNPVGQSSISVTSSPFTYTAGNTPEDVFITGGTVSSIVKGSTTLASATNFSVHLEPNQSVVVTYSGAPTMVADKY